MDNPAVALGLALRLAEHASQRGDIEEGRVMLRTADAYLVRVERCVDLSAATRRALKERYRTAVCTWVQAALKAKEEVTYEHP